MLQPHYLCAVVLLGLPVLAGRVPAQPNAPADVAVIEQQRQLWRSAERARAQGDYPAACRALWAMSQMEGAVPPPFQDGPAGPAFADLLRTWQEEWAVHADAESLASRRGGRPCARCLTAGFTVCRDCSGTGTRRIKIGTRFKEYECDPGIPCGACGGLGRLDVDPPFDGALGALRDAAMAGAREADPMVALRSLGPVTAALPRVAETVLLGEALREIIQLAPIHPDHLGATTKAAFRAAWDKAPLSERRAFLWNQALESVSVVKLLGFLEGVDSPAVSAVLRQATPATLPELLFGDESNSGGFFKITATLEEPSAPSLLGSSYIPLRGWDRRLVACFHYSPALQDQLHSAHRLGIVPGLDRAIRNYPPRSVEKAVNGLKPGDEAVFVGRWLRGRSGPSLGWFEVWAVEPVESLR